ncbi:hypothetical protein [Paraburkholderia caffeinilytica]|uniref:hypothetical protein n=1 Tax=Paraburkholderia caffeinilytica TaxID=1761016 RepID=UPI0038BDC762
MADKKLRLFILRFSNQRTAYCKLPQRGVAKGVADWPFGLTPPGHPYRATIHAMHKALNTYCMTVRYFYFYQGHLPQRNEKLN